jgi:hypothetical protein
VVFWLGLSLSYDELDFSRVWQVYLKFQNKILSNFRQLTERPQSCIL